ncbi:MAG: S8 family serine peptidase [Rubrivivax sp.]|nr:S8 family serine peptidase [Rubrivivax sp.]
MRVGRVLAAGLLAAGALMQWLAPAEVHAAEAKVVVSAPDARQKTFREDLLAPFSQGNEVRVIVGLQTMQGLAQPVGRSTDQAREQDVAGQQSRVLGRLAGQNARVVKRLRLHPFMVLSVDSNALGALLADPEVISLAIDQPRYPVLMDTPGITRATNAWAVGVRGAGQVVAILDSGVDASHPFFTGKVVAQACFSNPVGANTPYCPGGASQSTAVGSGAPCLDYNLGCWHGTHVAGIAAGRTGVLGTTSGIAPDAGIIAIQVFQKECTGGSCKITAYDSDIVAALEHVYSLRSTYNIASANLSLGGNLYTQACDASFPAYKAVIDSLRSANIATVIASGNNGNAGAISSPGCLSNAISVGSTTKQNAISSFSNSASGLSLLAPGSSITSSVPYAVSASGFGAANGTSMAAPHVTGAWAMLKSVFPSITVPEALSALQNSGIPITDPRNGLVKSLIQIGDAPGQPGALGLLALVRPTATLTTPVNGASYVAPATITLTASATRGSTGAAISRVEFYSGTTKIGESLAAPYIFSWTGVPQGAYNFSARAIDSLGSFGVSAPASISVAAPTYQISGTVTLNGTALSSVSLAGTNGVSCTPSNAAGQYNCTVPSGWSGSVTPSLSGYTFAPASRSYSSVLANQTAQNYAAAAVAPTTFQLSGTVTLSGTAMGSVSLAATNGASCTPSNAAGQYNCTVPSGWSGSVTPSLSGYTFAPASRSYSSVLANQTAQNYAAAAVAPTTFQLSGTVTLSGTAMGSVSLAATNGASCAPTNAAGQYSCTVPSGWSGSVNPSLSGYTFAPASRSYSSVLANQIAQNYAASAVSADTVWLDDAAPSGATLAGQADGWNWVSANPAPFSGSLAHQSALVSGTHQHYFISASESAACRSGRDAVRVCLPGSGQSPQPGDAAVERRLVGASGLLGCEHYSLGRRRHREPTLHGSSSHCGAVGAAGGPCCLGRARRSHPQRHGLHASEWPGDMGSRRQNQFSVGDICHRRHRNAQRHSPEQRQSGRHQRRELHPPPTPPASTTARCLQAGPAASPPSLSGYTFAPASRSYSSVLANQTAQNYAAAAVAPTTFQLSGTVTLSGTAMGSVSLAATNGASCTPSNAAGQYNCTVPSGWSGSVTPSLSGYTFAPASRSYSSVLANQIAQNYAASAVSADTVWLDDAAPSGATLAGQADGWNWVSANPAPFSGSLAHQSALVSGTHQHYFISASSPLPVAAGETLFAYVFLDPANPPSQVMLQWNDGSWEHRAYWGANIIPWGVDGTVSRRFMGALPTAGQWVRLEVPAALVGLVGRTLNGMAFTLQNGRATWDRAGKTNSVLATYAIGGTVTLNGTALSSVSLAGTNGVSCTPSNAAGQYNCTVPSGWSGSVTPFAEWLYLRSGLTQLLQRAGQPNRTELCSRCRSADDFPAQRHRDAQWHSHGQRQSGSHQRRQLRPEQRRRPVQLHGAFGLVRLRDSVAQRLYLRSGLAQLLQRAGQPDRAELRRERGQCRHRMA